jgi:hypothetical protein
MYQHEHESDDAPLARTRAGRRDSPAIHPALVVAGGRLDALTPAGLLGLQRAIGNGNTTSVLDDGRSPVHDVVGTPGEPLNANVRADMEERLGHDFGDVRLHTDGAAEDSARSVNAKAYTVGSHIAFQRSAYDPSSESGRITLAHELTHVVQQRSGAVDGVPAAGGIRVSDPSDRFEREAASTAERAVSTPVQRQTADEEQEDLTAQGLVAQRDEQEEEPDEIPE